MGRRPQFDAPKQIQMTLVDTGVWIDFLRGEDSPEVDVLLGLLNNDETVCFTGVILQELMQGCSTDAQARSIESRFAPFIEIFPQRTTYRLAAEIYRRCRSEGYTIRSAIDCLVSACALENDCEVHHQDRDYEFIREVCAIRILGK